MSRTDGQGTVSIADVDNLDPVIQRLSKRIDELQTIVDEQAERIQELEKQVDLATPDPNQTEYEDLSRAEKVSIIHSKLVEDAKKSNGKAAWGYKTVQQLFDGYPSNSHCYTLMELAGQRQGFTFGRSSTTGNKRLTVDLRQGKEDDPLFS